MRPAFRIVPAALAAFVVALALTSAAQPHRAPPHPSKRTHPVSSAVPYIAPWQSGFEKFATQVFTAPLVAPLGTAMTVPDGQWWRIVYLSVGVGTSAVVGDRLITLGINDAHGHTMFQQAAPVVQPASSDYTYTFAPNVTSYSNVTVPLIGQTVAAIPDVLWPQGSIIEIDINAPKAGDVFDNMRNFAVEIYKEERSGVLVPKLTPTPMIP